ncbi:16S rRNA (guanine(527)-N(7))-methyltransferase RsmG [Halosquirtibacter laminarini]|uniref:16S rRNA (Guanine(527)-N(7))-methyltransferase RsmG n=1 Tax=Halosquirtibacter laminarini TaxID=3374600 RepID=A0AC61ND88_9BACT|nr:16S rRNA (guanine(527)-N(7))-methyltransferase RsmG [Prolixibacteraceae bacterium]
MDIILKYFPDLTEEQESRFAMLKSLYTEWNEKVNVISRKDIDHLYEKHVLHSLSIAKVMQFKPGTKVLDVGTGGGFPGVPLAILFPETEFLCVDAIGKKITVVNGVCEALGLTNIRAEHTRVQNVKEKFDFIVSRAVTAFPKFVAMSRAVVQKKSFNQLANGILYIKGGDFIEEIANFGDKCSIYPVSDFFDEDFFETKKVIHLAL